MSSSRRLLGLSLVLGLASFQVASGDGIDPNFVQIPPPTLLNPEAFVDQPYKPQVQLNVPGAKKKPKVSFDFNGKKDPGKVFISEPTWFIINASKAQTFSQPGDVTFHMSVQDGKNPPQTFPFTIPVLKF